jgi:hypothetical protein
MQALIAQTAYLNEIRGVAGKRFAVAAKQLSSVPGIRCQQNAYSVFAWPPIKSLLRTQDHAVIVTIDFTETKSRSAMKTPSAPRVPAASRSRQAGRLDAQPAACLAFGAAVLASIVAAAAVASHELPLMLGGF